jgi:4-alpha-glucanotransferase
MTFPRESGILLHPTSLPGPHGIGDFGDGAFRFVEWLERAGQRLWQVMPLGPTGFGDSPYSSPSAFAGNPLLISLAWLQGDGLLTGDDLAPAADFSVDRVDYERVTPFKMDMLRRAYDRLEGGQSGELRSEFESYLGSEPFWLDDFALFTSIKAELGGGWWLDWPADIRAAEPEAIQTWREKLAGDIRFHKFIQFLFQRQWSEIRTYANQRNIDIVGDIPIFVALDSADVWANQGEFQFDPETGLPTFVAGVPPDFFSETGQRWGNPTYDWKAMKANGYRWWIERLRATRDMVDVVRIDHFRGFGAAWHVPFDEDTAENGHWELAPGGEVFAAVRKELGAFPLIVEDLGIITPDVVALREILGFPGMNVLHFAFDGDPSNAYLPHNHQRNSVTYTATHDNQTTVGWWSSISEKERDTARRYLGHGIEDVAWDMLRVAWASAANTAIAPMQDILRLGDEARMNTPATASGNWAWRLRPDQLDPALADGLRNLTSAYGRIPGEGVEQGENPWDYTDPASGVVATKAW